MILSVLVASLLAADDGPCSITGTVALLRDGEKVSDASSVAVYVDHVPMTTKLPARTHEVLQKGYQFEPKVLLITIGDKVAFTNDDKVEHSVFSNTEKVAFDFPPTRKGFTGAKVFRKPGAVRIQCDIHKKMRADLLVTNNPFATLAKPNGTFRIDGLPAGDYRVMVWEPNGGESQQEIKCASETSVQLTVEEAQKPTLKRKDGTAHREYQ